MVNSVMSRPAPMRAIGALVRAYVVIVSGTVVALAVMAWLEPALATQEAWVHAVIVAAFAVVLPLRLRSARAGSRGAL